jgi:MipA family protein
MTFTQHKNKLRGLMRVGLASAGLAVIVLSIFLTAKAKAADDTPKMPPNGHPQSDWNFVLGGGGGFNPDYEGSNDYTFSPIPMVSASYKNYVFVNGPSARVNFLGLLGDDFPVMAGVSAGLGGGRKHSANKALDNLGDIDSGLDVGGFVGSQLGPIQLGMELSKEVGDKRDGMYANFTLGYMQPIGDQFAVNLGVSAGWADQNWMQEYYGVTSAQSVASGYTKYDGKAGFKSVGIMAGADYMITEHITLGLNVGYTKLLDNAANSPIVKDQGSSNQYTGSLTASYRF